MKKNVELARKVVEQIRAHPEEHDQDVWWHVGECGTTRCFAGWAAYFSGATPIRIMGEINTGSFVYATDVEHNTNSINLIAADALGISLEEAGRIFYSHNFAVIDAASQVFGEEL